jgi:hypothetical protein
LGVAAELRKGQRAEHDRREHRDRRDRASDLLEQSAQRHKAETTAADVLGQRDA